MLAKRIIPCLDIKNGRTVKGVNFLGLQDAGDPVELAYHYCQEGADELVFLDIAATNENRKTLKNLVKEIARNINIPFTIGGGISSLSDAEILLNAGADKISVNTAAVRSPDLINDLASKFGSQFVVVAVDTNSINSRNLVYLNGGTIMSGIETTAWIKQAENMGAGEILLTSMDKDGTKTGFNIELLKEVNDNLKIPIIASGGAGTINDFVTLFLKTNVNAALAASVFHYGEITISNLKKQLIKNGISVRL